MQMNFVSVIISGDLNCDIRTVESVCSDFAVENNFVFLQDALYYKWYTHMEESDKVRLHFDYTYLATHGLKSMMFYSSSIIFPARQTFED